ncbi:hypothetical protein GOODEAATRI_004793 [Goodea atripinnis]|uniref:Ubiquitin-like domain-containing protein n=1 Tax=Goodea atripinnis TaxID=208336 RepID=A0ABV0PBG0_9TELE
MRARSRVRAPGWGHHVVIPDQSLIRNSGPARVPSSEENVGQKAAGRRLKPGVGLFRKPQKLTEMSEEKPKEGVKTENDHINLKVAGQDGSVVQFKIKRHTPLSKLMKAYCERQGLSKGQIRFRFDGQPINETDTPAQLGLQQEFGCGRQRLRSCSRLLFSGSSSFQFKQGHAAEAERCKHITFL